MTRSSLVALAAAVAACSAHPRPASVLEPLTGDGEVYVYLEPPESPSRLAFTLDAVEAARADGARLPLELLLRDVGGAQPRQRLLAFGRLPPGEYPALLLGIRRATLRGGETATDLHVPAEPARVAVPLAIARGRATVLSLTLDPGRSVDAAYTFAPAFGAAVPVAGVTTIAGYCTNSAAASLTVFDRHRRRVTGVLPVGREPRGLAVDAVKNRAFVALAGDDQVEVLDLLSGTSEARVSLRRGDRPLEVALTPDARLLVSVNAGSSTASFIDPGAAIELDRVTIGEDPTALLLDRSGRRAYVLSRRPSALTVLDLTSRAVAATVRVEADPVRAQLNRAGTRLYVAHAGSPYLSVLSVPDLAVTARVFVGMGATTVRLDPRTELLYVARRDDPSLQVFDPLSLLPVNRIELPAAAAALGLDDQENALLALHPDEREVSFVDLATRQASGAIDVGAEPYAVTVAGERL